MTFVPRVQGEEEEEAVAGQQEAMNSEAKQTARGREREKERLREMPVVCVG